MPGYVMHMAEAEILLARLRAAGRAPGEAWENLFRLGCLFPDTKRRGEKSLSHFWPPEDAGKLALAPELSRFLDLYRSELKNSLVLGYYVHLHLDTYFVHEYWRDQFLFLNAEGREEEIRRDITTVHIRKTGEEVSVEEFFSPAYYYGDYSRMNEPFLKRFSPPLPVFDPQAENPIREVNYADLLVILGEVHRLMEGYYNARGDQTLRVFDLEDLIAFIEKTALRIYPEIIDNTREL